MDKRLNLGCGDSILEGYLNIDAFDDHADLMIDIIKRLPFDDASVDEIKAIHVVEHFSRDEWPKIAKDWIRILKPGGRIVVATPNFPVLCAMYASGQPVDMHYAYISIFGSQEHDGQYHKQGFSHKSLSDCFPGFKCTGNKEDETEIRMELIK